MTTKIPLCLCKRIADLDEIAIREGRPASLSQYSKCFSCSGTNINCKNYSHPFIKEEDKPRLLKEITFGQRYGLFGSEL